MVRFMIINLAGKNIVCNNTLTIRFADGQGVIFCPEKNM